MYNAPMRDDAVRERIFLHKAAGLAGRSATTGRGFMKSFMLHGPKSIP
jgi:hypothetical protein